MQAEIPGHAKDDTIAVANVQIVADLRLFAPSKMDLGGRLLLPEQRAMDRTMMTHSYACCSRSAILSTRV